MKARFTVVILLGIILSLFHLVAGIKPVLDPSPTRWTFKETCRREPRPDWCREFYEDLELGRR